MRRRDLLLGAAGFAAPEPSLILLSSADAARIKGVGDMLNGGAVKLGLMIEQRQYRLAVIDTFSRSIRGDQMDVAEMTRALRLGA